MMEYDVLSDDDMIKNIVSEEPLQTEDFGDVKFGAYFPKDIDGDGYNEKVLGTCNSLDSSDTMLFEINVTGDGSFKNGKITIDGEKTSDGVRKNYRLSMAELADTVLKENCVSSDVDEIKFNELFAGMGKLLRGNVCSAIQDKDDYSRKATITLEGTYEEDGQEPKYIKRVIELDIDWYGAGGAKVCNTSSYWWNYSGYKKVEDLPEERKEFYFDFGVEANSSLIPKSYAVNVEIPSLYGVYPESVMSHRK